MASGEGAIRTGVESAEMHWRAGTCHKQSFLRIQEWIQMALTVKTIDTLKFFQMKNSAYHKDTIKVRSACNS